VCVCRIILKEWLESQPCLRDLLHPNCAHGGGGGDAMTRCRAALMQGVPWITEEWPNLEAREATADSTVTMPVKMKTCWGAPLLASLDCAVYSLTSNYPAQMEDMATYEFVSCVAWGGWCVLSEVCPAVH
jgi:hypothetical protein